MTDLTLSVDKTIHAPIERVYDAWLDPAMLTQFILPAQGMPNPEVENDPREGGRFTIVMHVGDDRIPHTGTYRVLDRPRCIEFSWESPYSTDDSVVTLRLDAIDPQRTRVNLTHVRFLSEEARDDHEAGWGKILDELVGILN